MRLRALGLWLAVLLMVSPALSACTGTAKREASALAEAVDRFTRTSNAIQVEAVGATSCTDALVCEAKGVCMAALDPTARALALKDEVGAKIADIEAARLAPDSTAAQQLPVKLDEASRLLREGHEKMQKCNAKLADLRVTYGF